MSRQNTDVRPHNCVIGRTYLLKTERGWEEAKALGKSSTASHYDFQLVRRGWFGTQLFAPIIQVHMGAESLRTSEPLAEQ